MDDKPSTVRVGATALVDRAAAEKLRAAIEAAGFKPGGDEGQVEWVFGRLAGALSVYLFLSGRGPDTPEGERRLLEKQIREARKQNPQFQYTDLEPEPAAPNEGESLTRFIKALGRAREHWGALEPETQEALGLSRFYWKDHADGSRELVSADPLQVIVERAERVKQERTGGRPRNEALDTLLKSIVWEWWCVFVEDPRDSPRAGVTYSGNAADNRVGGPLFKFTCAVLKSHDIPYTPSALGRRLHVFVTQTWQMSRHENPPAKAN